METKKKSKTKSAESVPGKGASSAPHRVEFRRGDFFFAAGAAVLTTTLVVLIIVSMIACALKSSLKQSYRSSITNLQMIYQSQINRLDSEISELKKIIQRYERERDAEGGQTVTPDDAPMGEPEISQ